LLFEDIEFMKKFLFNFLFVLIIFPLACWAQTSDAEMEQAIFNELNALRADPAAYVALLEEYKKLFEGKNVNLNGQIYQTFDGVKAVDEAIKFLQKAAKLEPFKLSTGLTKSAQLQVTDLKENINLGLIGKDGSSIPKRANKFGKGGKLYAANIGFYHTTAKDIVLNMIIDDGVSGRGNRKNIFNKNLQIAGVAFGRGKNGEPITFIVFADKYVENTN
jgi:uncharacterized protein YkwD